MPAEPRSRRSILRRVALSTLAIGAVAGGAWAVREANRPARLTLQGLSFSPARRVDLHSSLLAGGRTESAASTEIECQLERLEMRVNGRSSSSSGASTILSVIDEGSWVKKGDVLCTIDSSEYVEIVRQQEMNVDRARADLQEAKLNFETAQMTVQEFRDGLVAQTVQDYEGRVKLAQADRQRAEDRLAWSSKMLVKGYVAADQVSNDRQTLRKAELAITKSSWTLDNFLKFGVPMETRALQSSVEIARVRFNSNERRFSRFLERLEHYKKMVENCTIRAPHDGYLIYEASENPYSSTSRVEPGASVRQGQDLFVLPDLSRMQVITVLHESVVDKVKVGMVARAKIEGLANRELEGHVIKVNPLPDLSSSWLSEAKFFNATVQIDVPPRDIRPSMSAEVEIDLGRRPNVVAIPSEALSHEGNADVCYVATGDGSLERRAIRIGQSSLDLLEVVDGLEEGESVVSDLTHIADYGPLIVDGRPLPAKSAPSPDPAPTPVGPEVTATTGGVVEAERAGASL